jgi:hypothetical protein
MLIKVESINIGVDLAKANLISYQYIFYENNDSYKGKILHQLTITLQIENGKEVELVFYKPVSFMDKGGDVVMDFCLSTTPTDFFIETMREKYKEIPEEYPEKHYIFLNPTQKSCLEIISPYFEFTIKDSNHLI